MKGVDTPICWDSCEVLNGQDVVASAQSTSNLTDTVDKVVVEKVHAPAEHIVGAEASAVQRVVEVNAEEAAAGINTNTDASRANTALRVGDEPAAGVADLEDVAAELHVGLLQRATDVRTQQSINGAVRANHVGVRPLGFPGGSLVHGERVGGAILTVIPKSVIPLLVCCLGHT